MTDANDREAKLIDETLAGDGFVEVVLEREGVRETWKRTTGNHETIVATTGTGTIDLTTSAARERFRSRAFRQKGLSSTMNDPATASEQITSIAAAEELDQQRNVERLIKNAQRDVRTALSNLASLWQARLESKQAKDRVDDLRQRLAALTARLEAEGASAEALATLEEAPKYSRVGESINRVREQAEDGIQQLTAMEGSILGVDFDGFEGAEDFAEVAALKQTIEQSRKIISTEIERAKAALTDLLTRQAEADLSFKARYEAFSVKYDTAVEEQSKHASLIDEVTRLTKELQTAESIQAKAKDSAGGKAVSEKAYDDAIVKLDELLEQRRAILKSAADKVADKSSNLLRARVRKDQMPDEYLSGLLKLFEASFTQQAEEGCSSWVTAVLADEEGGGWSGLRKSFLELYESKIMAGSPPEASDGLLASIQSVIFKGARSLTERQRKKIYLNLNDAVVAGIVSAAPKDAINMSYMDDGRAIDFKMASPGQQASALLELLLKQSAGTLIIDQPEDDLDNRVIMRIVELLRKSKSNRQLIFSTHNSNIVVNGDADKVIALISSEPSSNPNVNTPRVRLDCDGAIETPSIRSAITSIMEGGRDAFDLRSRKYGFEFN